ncbi:hypothetical protein R3P38DRAFT_2829985 [Favolaschia claudopus]|uniref:DUF6534 domain-containing protein n=1 Tax=Favolaschia claudopus TaxID=2862362 RepID=A0AAW0E7P1_9AGAR
MGSPLEVVLGASLVPVVKQLFATSFIGYSLSTTLYGFSILQVYMYYRNDAKDPVLLKFVVALVFTLDTLTTMFASHSIYTFFVLNFQQTPIQDLLNVPWTLITFVAQCFYAERIWHITPHKTIPAFIAFLAVVCLGLGIVTTVEIFTIQGVIGTPRFSIISGFVQGLAAINDITISIAMCYYLTQNRGGLPATNKFVDTVVLYTISRGILTATTQIAFLITNVGFPGNTYYLPFHMCVGKFYVNSILSTLNIRQMFQREPEQIDTGPTFNFYHPDQSFQEQIRGHNTSKPASIPAVDHCTRLSKPSEKSDLKMDP